MPSRYAHIRNWIFDLDNTLYPASCNLFELMGHKMNQYIRDLLDVERDEAHSIQKRYFYEYGTTLAGLMANHGIDAHDYLAFVHDIDLARLSRDDRMVRALAALPGRKLIFTNADAPYARAVLERLGMGQSFEKIHDIHASLLAPKPQQMAYDCMVAHLEIDPRESLFVEDMARNLAPAKAMGMHTIWLNNGSEGGLHEIERSAIDEEISDLGGWLSELAGIDAQP